jgi:hypothetical protein
MGAAKSAADASTAPRFALRATDDYFLCCDCDALLLAVFLIGQGPDSTVTGMQVRDMKLTRVGPRRRAYAALPQPCGLKTRSFDGGNFASFSAGRIGRGEKLPPQFGQRPLSRVSTQSRQNVHSKVQIIASVAWGGRSLSQHSQFGRSASMQPLQQAIGAEQSGEGPPPPRGVV